MRAPIIIDPSIACRRVPNPRCSTTVNRNLYNRIMNSEVQVVEPAGILDGMRAAEFRQEISDYVDQGAKVVLIDFKDVTFMDSSGLGALVLSLKTVRAANIKMCLCSINEQIKMLFELTSMDRVFEIYDDRDTFEDSLAAKS